jgi:GntR family histidine utilization transcriptional repressor
MGELLKTQDKSLHERILREIETKILSGEWAPGYRIPFEHELQVDYSCSRMTVNKAVSELVKRGLIERRRRSGSFVSRPHAQSAVLEIHDIQREVSALGLPYRFELDDYCIRAGTVEEAAKLGLKAGEEILFTTARHYAGHTLFCFEQRLINVASVPEVRAERFQNLAPGTWLLQQVPWSAAEHRIRAASADKKIAEKLSVPVGTACLVIERKTWNGSQFITAVEVTYPGDRHELVAQFSPSHSA